MASERSPKRRRTGNATVSANAIAQANATLQVFLGQQQNRWMQGYAPPSTTNGESSAVSSARKERDTLATSRGNREQEPNAEGATRRTDAQFHGGLNVVEYESPTIINGPSAIPESIPTGTLDSMARTAAQPGLPSPAASDENGASPTVGVQKPANQIGSAIQPGVRPTRGRPPSTDHSHPAAIQTGSPAHRVHQQGPSRQRQQHSQTPSTSINFNRFVNVQTAGQLPPNAHGRSSPLVPSQPFVPAPQTPHQAQDSMLSQMVMFQRYQAFRKKEAPKYQLSGVDRGRLQLLEQAIDRADLFYIVLSQIHCLTNTPDLIPKSAQGLDPRCFQYLDSLICSTDSLSPNVREWLSTFPAPILKIYFSTQSAAIYEPMVAQVEESLRLLPQHWDRIVTESKSRQAPPLVEDLYDTFRLPSAVFQTTAFRAISRLVLDPDQFMWPEKGIDRLEILHKMDQMWFTQNSRRSPEEKSWAYRAFRITKEAWRAHEQRIREQQRQQPQNGQNQQPPHFIYPPDAFAAFQPRVGNFIPVVSATAMHYQTAAQQQQAMIATGLSLAQNPQRCLHPSITPAMRQQAAMAQPQNGPLMPQKQLAIPGFVYPRENEMPRAQPTNPDPIRSALHQAHLRSPTLGRVEAHPGAPRLYRHINGFALSPKKINKDLPVQTITFDIPQQNFERIPATVPSKRAGEPPSRPLTENSHTYRLRCASYPSDIGFPSESTWVVADNYWPENLYLEFNGVMLEPRRKLHHNRYLPIDLTHLVKHGENSIKAIVNRTSTDPRAFEYVLAVEIVGVTSHESIKTQLRTISAADTLKAIKTSLSSGNDDDDLAVTSSNLTIKLFDPYSSSKIFDTPVRGSACSHKDCFDLETFLSVCKREKPGWPTLVDCWRCPLCRGDVRPQTLIIDGFLVEVRKQLEKRNLLSTRAIVIEADGSWKPKEEERTGVRSPSLEREERSSSEKNVTSSASKKAVEIIEID